MMALPNWWEMKCMAQRLISAAYLGDVSVDEAIAGAEDWVSNSLESQRDQLNAARQKFGFPRTVGESWLATARAVAVPEARRFSAPGLGASAAEAAR